MPLAPWSPLNANGHLLMTHSRDPCSDVADHLADDRRTSADGGQRLRGFYRDAFTALLPRCVAESGLIHIKAAPAAPRPGVSAGLRAWRGPARRTPGQSRSAVIRPLARQAGQYCAHPSPSLPIVLLAGPASRSLPAVASLRDRRCRTLDPVSTRKDVAPASERSRLDLSRSGRVPLRRCSALVARNCGEVCCVKAVRSGRPTDACPRKARRPDRDAATSGSPHGHDLAIGRRPYRRLRRLKSRVVRSVVRCFEPRPVFRKSPGGLRGNHADRPHCGRRRGQRSCIPGPGASGALSQRRRPGRRHGGDRRNLRKRCQ